MPNRYGNTTERTPPHPPEVQPVEFLWVRLTGGYGKRYESTGAREYVDQFPADVVEEELSRVVSHCDSAAECLVSEEPSLLLEDDVAPLGDDADQPGRGEDQGETPGF